MSYRDPNSEGQAVRRALFATGAVLAVSAFGNGGNSIVLDSINVVATALGAHPHENAAQLFVAVSEGGKTLVAGAADTARIWFESVGVDLTRQARDILVEMRDYLGDSASAARALFIEKKHEAGSHAATLVSAMRNISPGMKEAGLMAWDVTKSAVQVLVDAASIWGVYKAYDEIRGHLFGRGKKKMAAEARAVDATPSVSTLNFNLNLSIAGGKILDGGKAGDIEALQNLSEEERKSVLWVAESFSRKLTEGVKATHLGSSDMPGIPAPVLSELLNSGGGKLSTPAMGPTASAKGTALISEQSARSHRQQPIMLRWDEVEMDEATFTAIRNTRKRQRLDDSIVIKGLDDPFTRPTASNDSTYRM